MQKQPLDLSKNNSTKKIRVLASYGPQCKIGEVLVGFHPAFYSFTLHQFS